MKISTSASSNSDTIMAAFYIIRLGADSVDSIQKLNAFHEFTSPNQVVELNCKQVPTDVQPGSTALIWLGTNNSKGEKTTWTQGLRAIGTILSSNGIGGYNDNKTLKVSIEIVFPRSVTKLELITKQSSLYARMAEMPVLGINNYSSQVVQKIHNSDAGQDLASLFSALEAIMPGLRQYLQASNPTLYSRLAPYISHSGTGSSSALESADPDDLEADLDREEQYNSGVDAPFDPTKIDIIVKPITISALETRLHNKELDLTPDFQRQSNIWNNLRKARLIESILLKIPLPSFYFSEAEDGGYAVVDGLQRLCAIFHFKDALLLNQSTATFLSPLRLEGLQYLKDLEGKTFAELDRKFQRRIVELEVTANIIRANTPSAVKFNVFARLNQGGMPLNAQEIRNAIFPGNWRDHLRKMAEGKAFLNATNGNVPRSRQQDMEMLLRFIALWHLRPTFIRPGNQTLDEFLNDTVEKVLVRWRAPHWDEANQAFENGVETVRAVLGKHAFRKSAENERLKPINRGLFESQLVVFSSLNPLLRDKLVNARSDFQHSFRHALDNNIDFNRSLLYATGSAESSNIRVLTIKDILERVINAQKNSSKEL